MNAIKHDTQRYPLRTKSSYVWWDRSRNRPQSGYPPSQILCPEYYGGEICNASGFQDKENAPRREKTSDNPLLTTNTDTMKAGSDMQTICSPNAEGVATGPTLTRPTTVLSKPDPQRSPSVASYSDTSRPGSFSSVADSEIFVPDSPENEVDHRISRLLRSPVTSKSDHLRGPDGKPLGVEVAINAYHRGEYSTGFLDQGCLPSGLHPRTAQQLTSRYYGDHGTGFGERKLATGLDLSTTIVTPETGRLKHGSLAVRDEVKNDGAPKSDLIMKPQSCGAGGAHMALGGGVEAMESTKSNTPAQNQSPMQAESCSAVSRLRIPENRHLRPAYKFARPNALRPRDLSKEYNVVQNPFVEGTKSPRPLLVQLGEMMLPISPVELAAMSIPSHHSHHRSRSTPSQAHIHPLLRIPTEKPAKTHHLRRSMSDASPQHYTQAALGAPIIGSQLRYVFENDSEEDHDPHKSDAITRHVSSMSSSMVEFPSTSFHSPSPSLSTFPSSISGSPYRHRSILHQHLYSETLEWHKGSGNQNVTEKTLRSPTPFPASRSGQSLPRAPNEPSAGQAIRVSRPRRSSSSAENISSSVLDNDNRSTQGEPLNSSMSSIQEIFAEIGAEVQLDHRLDAMLTTVAPTSTRPTDTARVERLYTQPAYMTRSLSRSSLRHNRALSTASDLYLSSYAYRPSPPKTRIAHIQTPFASKYYPGPIGSPQKLAQILGKEVLGPLHRPPADVNEEHDQMVRKILGSRAESRMSGRRALSGIGGQVRRGLRKILG